MHCAIAVIAENVRICNRIRNLFVLLYDNPHTESIIVQRQRWLKLLMIFY